MTKEKQVTIGTGIGYGLVDFLGGGAFTVIGVYFVFFLTNYTDLDALQASSILGIARIIDAIASLSIGSITDNFYKTSLGSKFGRRRFFLLIGSPLMLIYAMLWINGGNYWYYLFVFIAFEIISAMILIPWETLPAEMTTDYNKRTILSTARMFISAGATFLATFLTGRIIASFTSESGVVDPHAYLVMGTSVAVFLAVCIFITYKVTWEREISQEEKDHLAKLDAQRGTIMGVFKSYGETLKVRAFRQHIGIYLLSFTGKDVFNQVFLFFCTFAIGVGAATGSDFLSLSIVALPMTIIAGFLMIKIGPSGLFKLSYGLMIICLAAYWYVFQNIGADHKYAGSLTILFIIAGVYQVGRGILEFTPWNVFPFIPDVDEMMTKERRAGLFAAVMTFARKSSVAIAAIAVGAILKASGFDSSLQVQSESAINTIVNTMVFGTSGFLILALIIVFKFKLNKQTHGILVDEINRLKEGGSKNDVTLETKKVVEDLTGRKYEDCWK